jgi:hypothetical protein
MSAINNKTILHVTGMFRSGTTLVARMLNTHSEISLASDPLFEFFKAFRNELFIQNNIENIDLDAPLDKNFKSQNAEINKKFENINFDLEVKNTDLVELSNNIKKRSEPFSPIYSSQLKPFFEKNFREILNSTLKTIEKSYHKENGKILGFKTVWAEQFTPTLLNEFKNRSKVIFIIRDPRAVIASNYVKTDRRYPLEFLIRQWRKSICYAILYTKIISKFKNDSLLVKYEELILKPEQEIEKICDFLGIKFEKELLKPSNYKDGNNELWKQNTSYAHGKNQFNTKSIDKWKDVLSDEILKFVEFTCKLEMNLLNYELRFGEKEIEEVEYPKDDFSTLAKWIKKYYPEKLINNKKWNQEIKKDEMIRNLHYKKGIIGKIDDLDTIENYFIDKRYFSYIVNEGKNE